MPGDKNATEDRIDKEQEFALRLAVAQSRTQQELYLDTIADGALSAAQQVQDKRLDLLEAGPEVSVSDIFIDLLITLALGPVAGFVLSKATKAMFAKILSTRGAARDASRIAPPELIKQVSELNPKVIAQARMSPEDIKTEFPIATGSRQYDLYRKVVDEVLGVGLDVMKDRAKGAALRNDKSVPSKKETGSDSAGVAITDAVQQFAREQKATTNLVHDRLDLELQRGVNQETAKELQSLLAQNLSKLPHDTSTAKERYKVLFEACIWVRLFKGTIWETGLINIPTGDPTTGFPKSVSVRGRNAPDELIDYWMKRFPHLGWRFNFSRSIATEYELPDMPRVLHKSFSEELKGRKVREAALEQYFMEIDYSMKEEGGFKTERLIPKSQ